MKEGFSFDLQLFAGAGFDPIRAVVGTFGYIFKEGKWLSQYNKAQASVEIGKAEIKPAGDRWIRHKVVSLKGTGTISGYKVTDELLKEVSVVAQSNQPSFRTELLIVLADPEAFGAERIRLKNVMFDKVGLANWEHGAEIQEEWAFTFEGYELVDLIEA